MSRVRVIVTTDLVGGVFDFALTLAEALPDDVLLLALGEPTPSQHTAALSVAETVFAPLKLEWMHDSVDDVVRTQELICDLVGKYRPQVVHANQFAVACANLDVPLVLTVHSDVLSWRRWTLGSSDLPVEWLAYQKLVSRALVEADHVVAVSDFLANEVHDLYAFDGPIEVIHNGWPAPRIHALASRHGTLVAGRAWDAAKNILLAVEAAQRWNPGPVYLAGDQHHPESGDAITVDAPITVLGHLPRRELDTLLQRTAIYLSPARYDPFGLLPLQAALHGAALLLSDIPSYRELWDGAACFFHSNDAASLRSQWQSLLWDPERTHALARAAAERARTRFAVEPMTAAYQGVYARVAKAKPTAGAPA